MDKYFQHGFFINLEHRTDRLASVKAELAKVGISSIERFNAIKMAKGAIGCTMSHIKCLQLAKQRGWSHAIIVEDDIMFLDPELFLKQLGAFMDSGRSWDVIILGGNNTGRYIPIDDCCVQVTSCQTTTGYIVNGHYIDTLLKNFMEGVNLLMRYPDKPNFYAIDQYWFYLQKQHNWFLIIPQTVVQAPSYSDIEQRHTDYKNLMTTLDKPVSRNSAISRNSTILRNSAVSRNTTNNTSVMKFMR